SRLNRQWWLPEAHGLLDAEGIEYLDRLRRRTREYEEQARRPSGAAHDPATIDAALAALRSEWRRLFASWDDLEVTTSESVKALPPGGAVVMPVLTVLGCIVFVIPAGTVTVSDRHVVQLPQLTTDSLHQVTRGT